MKLKYNQSYLFLAVLTLIWGASFILIKKALVAFSPPQLGSLRIIIAGILFLPYTLLNLKKLNPANLKYILLFGLLEIGIPPYLYSLAQTRVDSSTAGILNSLVPLFTLITGVLCFRMKLRAGKLFGVLIGLAGAILLVFTRSTSGGAGFALDFSNQYGLLIVFATILYGLGSNVLQTRLHETPSLLITGISFVSMSIPASVILLSSHFPDLDFSSAVTQKSLLAITVLSTFGSAIAIWMLGILIQKSGALFSSFVTYLIPFVALFWGFLDGEPLNVAQFLCMGCILAGIYIANRANNLQEKPGA